MAINIYFTSFGVRRAPPVLSGNSSFFFYFTPGPFFPLSLVTRGHAVRRAGCVNEGIKERLEAEDTAHGKPTDRMLSIHATCGESPHNDRTGSGPRWATVWGIYGVLGCHITRYFDATIRSALMASLFSQRGRHDEPIYLEVWQRSPEEYGQLSELKYFSQAIEFISRIFTQGDGGTIETSTPYQGFMLLVVLSSSRSKRIRTRRRTESGGRERPLIKKGII